jgi:hypothetical protein
MSGVILDTVTHGRRENKRMHYLAQPAPEGREYSGDDESIQR